MLLALWSAFWNSADWTPGSVSATATPVVVINLGAGGGYHRADSDYWDAREEMMRRYAPTEAREVPVTPERVTKAEKIVKKINRAVQIIPKMPDLASLHRMQALLDNLTGQLNKLVLDSDEDALLVLLL